MELEITITQNLTDGKTCNLVDGSMYEDNAPYATNIIENSVNTVIDTVIIPNGGTVTTTLPDTTYNFYVAGNPVPVTIDLPTLEDETINIVWQ